MKILNFGSCNIDHVYSLDHIVGVGETETTHSIEIFPGGKGLNQAIAASKAGAKSYFAGCVGCDGDILTEFMANNGVDISYVNKISEKNGHAIIQVSKTGENSIFIYPGSNETITEEYIDRVLENFDENDIIILQNEINNTDIIVDKAYEKRMRVVLNPSPYNGRIEKIDFNKLSYLILNEVEAKAVSGCGDTEETKAWIKRRYPNLKLMLTLGSEGCVYTDSEVELNQYAFKVEAVDTTAAGDTFTGYFAAGLADGEDIGKILKTASAASAIAVSRKGAAPSIPDKSEVTAAMSGMEEKVMSRRSDVMKKKIEEYIDKNIVSASLAELAERLGYSAVYTGECIKKLTGKTFSTLVAEKRCRAAAEKLKNTDMPIKEIINAVGYENESYFRKIFKEKYGKNPLEFRKGR